MYDTGKRHERSSEKAVAQTKLIRINEFPRPTRAFNVQKLLNTGVEGSVMLPSGDKLAGITDSSLGIAILDVSPTLRLCSSFSTGELLIQKVIYLDDDVLVTYNYSGHITTWCVSTGEFVQHYYFGRHSGVRLITCDSFIVLAQSSGRFTLLNYQPDGSGIKPQLTFTSGYDDMPIYLASYESILVASLYNGETDEVKISVWNLKLKLCIARLCQPTCEGYGAYLIDINATYLIAARTSSVFVYAANEAHFPLQRIINIRQTDVMSIMLLTGDKALYGSTYNGTIGLICLKTGRIIQRTQTPFSEVCDISVTYCAQLAVLSIGRSGDYAVFDVARRSIMYREIEKFARYKYGKKFVQRKCRRLAIPKVVLCLGVLLITATKLLV